MAATPEGAAKESLRQRVVLEARSWIGTPWQRQACIKGLGVDCVMLLIGVYSAVGLIPVIEPPAYPSGWSLNDDRYLAALDPYLLPEPVECPQPGDLAVFRLGKHPAHAGIITDWPLIVHADGISAECVVESRADRAQLAKRFLYARTPKGLA